MSLILTKQPGNFLPHPVTENPVRAVIVDITPVKEVERTDPKTKEKYKKLVFRVVFETEVLNDEGKRWCVWSRPYGADGKDPLNEKANLRIDLKKILGRDLTADELKSFDVESTLLGKSVRLMVDHEESEGKVYDTITLIKHAAEPFAACGAYVRVKDRKKDDDAQYSAAAAPSKEKAAPPPAAAAVESPGIPNEPAQWEMVKIHLDGYGGVCMKDLDADLAEELATTGLAELEAKEKKLIADRRLIAAIKSMKSELGL